MFPKVVETHVYSMCMSMQIIFFAIYHRMKHSLGPIQAHTRAIVQDCIKPKMSEAPKNQPLNGSSRL